MPKKKFDPADHGLYYYLDFLNDPHGKDWDEDSFDLEQVSIGNTYRTQKEAADEGKRRKKAKGLKLGHRFRGGRK